MTSVMTRPIQTATRNPPHPDAEPDDAWKSGLRKQIEESLLPMVQEAKDVLQRKLGEAPVDQVTRDRLANEHSDTLKNIRRIADDLYRDQIEQERQQLKWAQGGTVERGWSEGLVKQQQAILEQIERDKAQKEPHQSRPVSTTNGTGSYAPSPTRQARQQSQWSVADSPSDKDSDYFTRPHNNRSTLPVSPGRPAEDRVTGRPRGLSGGSIYELQRPNGGDYVRSFVDEPEEIERPDRFPQNRASLRRQNSSTGPKPIPEIWKPSISPEEDAVLSRTSQLARRGSVASIQSGSYRSPSMTHFAERPDTLGRQNSVASPGPNAYRPPSATQTSDREHPPVARKPSNTSISSYSSYRSPSITQTSDRPDSRSLFSDVGPRVERERTGIQAAEEAWHDMTISRERQRPLGNRYRSDSGTRQSGGSGDYANIGSNANIESPISAGPSSSFASQSASTSRPIEIPRGSRPSSLLSTSRPSSSDDRATNEEAQRFQHPSLSLGGWAGPQRGQSVAHHESISRSPASIPEGSATERPYTQQQQWHSRPQISTYELGPPNHVPTIVRQTSNQAAQTSDVSDDSDSEDERREEFDRQTKAMEEEAKRREDEAQRREAEAKRREDEARRKEEEYRRKEEEARKKEEEVRRKEEEARQKEDEARRKEEEARKMADELRKKEAEAKKKDAAFKKKEAQAKKKEEEMRRKEAEAKRKEEEVRLMEAEAMRKREEAEQREEEARRWAEEAEQLERDAMAKEEAARQLEEETRKKEEEIMKREALLKMREEELERREREAQRKEEEKLRMQEEEERKRAEDAAAREAEEKRQRKQRAEEERKQKLAARKQQEEQRVREQEARRLEAEKRQAEVEQRERDLERREAEARRREEEREELAAKRAEEERVRRAEEERLRREREENERARIEEEERLKLAEEERLRLAEEERARLKQEEEAAQQRARRARDEEAAKRKREELAKRAREDATKRTRDEAAKRTEEERVRQQREEAVRRREEERARQEREEELEAIRQVEEMERREAEASERERTQQEEFRRREEEIRRRAHERRSLEEYDFMDPRPPAPKVSASPPASSPWPIPNSRSATGTPSQADRNSGHTGSSWASSSSRPSFNGTPPSTARTSMASTASKPIPTPSRSNAYSNSGTSPMHSMPSEEEWARRQEEQARKQQEAFRREQEQQEMKRQAQMGKILSKDDVLQLFKIHEGQWSSLPTLRELGWNSFPWPVWKRPREPEDLTSTHVGAYVLSQYYPGAENKSSKERIKEHIRRWHPDRFETKYLPKVVPEEREKVKAGAGVVARVLNEMLTRSNDAFA
ncbi:hypothetical protein HWV62_42950 [Athelia sp. TMB]|nr:hypothetical protein HWV62_42950 [Athelia sp. TMB]